MPKSSFDGRSFRGMDGDTKYLEDGEVSDGRLSSHL